MTRPAPSPTGTLVRLGFREVDRAHANLTAEPLSGGVGPDLLAELGNAADPDLALLSLARVVAAAGDSDVLLARLNDEPNLAAGTIGVRPGTQMAASDGLTVRLLGRGGHGSRPHATIDPVVMAAATVMAVPAAVL